MEKKNTGMKITIVILCLLVVGLTGYIVYDNIFSEENDKCIDNNISNEYENNTSQNENIGFITPSEHVELEENIKFKLIDIFNFVYDYNKSKFYGNYCVGDTDANDIIEPPSGSDSMHKFNIASSEYSSFDEMIDYLKKYMTENIIYSTEYMSSDNYIERDGKLYCPFYDTGKGGIYEFEDVKIKYSKPWMNGFYATMETTLKFHDSILHEIFDVTFKKKDNNWVIISYKQIS